MTNQKSETTMTLRTGILLCAFVPLMLGGKCTRNNVVPASNSHVYIICYPEHFFLGEEGCDSSPNLVVYTGSGRESVYPPMRYAEEPNYPDRVTAEGGGIYGLHYQIDWTEELLANIEWAGLVPANIPHCTNSSFHNDSVTPWVTQISIVNCTQPLDVSEGPLTTGILAMVTYLDAEIDLTIPITVKNTIAVREDGTLALAPKRGLSSITILDTP
jgi:hypothetical protein